MLPKKIINKIPIDKRKECIEGYNETVKFYDNILKNLIHHPPNNRFNSCNFSDFFHNLLVSNILNNGNSYFLKECNITKGCLQIRKILGADILTAVYIPKEVTNICLSFNGGTTKLRNKHTPLTMNEILEKTRNIPKRDKLKDILKLAKKISLGKQHNFGDKKITVDGKTYYRCELIKPCLFSSCLVYEDCKILCDQDITIYCECITLTNNDRCITRSLFFHDDDDLFIINTGFISVYKFKQCKPSWLDIRPQVLDKPKILSNK